MSSDWWPIAIGVGTLILNFLTAIIGGTWALSRSKNGLMIKFEEKLAARHIELKTELETLDHRFGSDLDLVERRVGETISAIRQKVTEVELWNRDNLVNKDTLLEIKETLRRFEDRLDKRLDRIEKELNGNGVK